MNRYNISIQIPNKVIVYNRLLNNYYLFKQFETGINLNGWEIKSLRDKRVEISKSYIYVSKQEVFINNLYIQPLIQHLHYNLLNNNNIEKRVNPKKLLLHKKEISYISNHINKKGFTIILICLYWKYKWCKALISIAKGKKIFDKRREIKDKEWRRKESILNNNMI